MKPPLKVKDDKSKIGAATRMIIALVVFLVTFVIADFIEGRLPRPDISGDLLNQTPGLIAVLAVLLVLKREFEVKPGNYGMKPDRQWLIDMFGGITIGIIFQALSTAGLLFIGGQEIVGQWSMGVFESYLGVIVASSAAVVAFFIVALSENLIFRGIMIKEFVIGFRSSNISGSRATIIAVIISSILFGILHLNSGLSTSVVVMQAVVGGIYFGIGYVLTDSLGLPIGIHLSTNLWTTLIFAESGGGYPAVFRLTREVDIGIDLIFTLILPSTVLIGAILLWVRITRGKIPEFSLSVDDDRDEIEE